MVAHMREWVDAEEREKHGDFGRNREESDREGG
jgi:hypothetical protein